jgi:hypothetical protein
MTAQDLANLLHAWELAEDALTTELARQPDLAKLLHDARAKLLDWEAGAMLLQDPIRLEEWLELVRKVRHAEDSK